jgi:aldehyde:ferredoxin oxidoreductase
MTTEALKTDLAYNFIGGRGFTSKLLYDELKPGIDPLGPENKIFVAVGPCNGTLVPGSTRITIAAKSPLSGLVGDGNSGATMGAELKYAGYDTVVIQGRAEKPSYLWIDDDNVQLKTADHLWGKTTRETRRLIEEELGDPDIQVASIGPAGENLVKFASIISDIGRAHGRCGLGAVMGSKNLKAIAVRGTKGVKIADPSAFEEAVDEMKELYRENAIFSKVYTKFGPLCLLPGTNASGGMPTKNFQGFLFPEIQRLSPDVIIGSSFTASRSCFSCPIHCQHYYLIDQGPYKGTYTEGVEFMDLTHYGTNLGNADRDGIVKMHALTNDLGLDLAETSGVMAWATECFERGILTLEETGGIKLEWGNHESFLKLIQMIASKEGFGDLLAGGLREASEKTGKQSERYALHVKGLVIDGREPRPFMGWALGYAVASRGGEHCRALFSGAADRTYNYATEGKAEEVVWHENVRAIQNSLDICEFAAINEKMLDPQMLVKFYNTVTGLHVNLDELLKIGERILAVERAFNVREGLTRKDDTLPERFLTKPIPEGPAKGQVVHLEPMIDRYYELRAWDKKTGYPQRQRLIELGLESAADELGTLGKLAH